MRLSIRASGIELSEELRRHVERRLLFALSRFGERVKDVTVRLADLNGPRGGIDKRCRMLAQLAPRGAIRVVKTDGDLQAAIDRCAERLGRSVVRELGRWRQTGVARAGGIRGRW